MTVPWRIRPYRLRPEFDPGWERTGMTATRIRLAAGALGAGQAGCPTLLAACGGRTAPGLSKLGLAAAYPTMTKPFDL